MTHPLFFFFGTVTDPKQKGEAKTFSPTFLRDSLLGGDYSFVSLLNPDEIIKSPGTSMMLV